MGRFDDVTSHRRILFCSNGVKERIVEDYSIDGANLAIFSEFCKKFGRYF